MMTPFLAEFLGTAVLIILGNGVVANVLLNRTKGNGAGWIVITFGWGMGVFVGVFCSSEYSGAHLNPAVTIALAAAHKWGAKYFRSWGDVPLYIAAQMAGAVIGGIIVYFFYKPHFDATEDGNAKLGCFATAPNIRSMGNAFFCEVVGTFTLVLPIFLMMSPSLSLTFGADTGAPTTAAPMSGKHDIGLGALGALPVGLLVLAIGLSLGGTTGYAINPARDLGPRIAHFILPIRGKRDSDWSYAWVPVAGPIVGGLLAAALARVLLPHV
jgi:glycerol uptake facilitator protein